MKKLQRDEKTIHTETSTTFKVDAGTKKYHCLFFCQRKVDSDVVDPRETAPREEAHAAYLKAKKEYHAANA